MEKISSKVAKYAISMGQKASAGAIGGIFSPACTKNFSTIMKGEKLIMSIDQGTTSSRALLINKNLEVVGVHQESHSQVTENPGWVSHNPMEIYKNVEKCIYEVMNKHSIDKSQIQGVGITNQRETTVAWDKNTGEPLHDAIVWLDKRNEKIVEDLIATHGVDSFRQTTGLPIATYFSATKMRWMLDNSTEVKKAEDEGRL